MELKEQLQIENRMKADGTQIIETRCPYCEKIYKISLPINLKYIKY